MDVEEQERETSAVRILEERRVDSEMISFGVGWIMLSLMVGNWLKLSELPPDLIKVIDSLPILVFIASDWTIKIAFGALGVIKMLV